jgi:hypothetical protein
MIPQGIPRRIHSKLVHAGAGRRLQRMLEQLDRFLAIARDGVVTRRKIRRSLPISLPHNSNPVEVLLQPRRQHRLEVRALFFTPDDSYVDSFESGPREKFM